MYKRPTNVAESGTQVGSECRDAASCQAYTAPCITNCAKTVKKTDKNIRNSRKKMLSKVAFFDGAAKDPMTKPPHMLEEQVFAFKMSLAWLSTSTTRPNAAPNTSRHEGKTATFLKTTNPRP